MIPTSAQTSLLRTQPHRTKAWLSIYKPDVALAAQVNDNTIAKGEREITYDSVTSGSYQLVEANFILLVGTAAGKADKGRVRVKSITSSVVTVAENSHINWADDDYITILRFVEIVPIFTRIIQNPANELDVIFYKDYDITYTNQNSILGAFVNMGCHHAGFLGSNSTGTVYYSASGTSHLITGTTMSYHWWFQGAAVTGSSELNPGYIPYNQAGQYVTRLIVSGSNGSVDTSYRYTSMYDHPSRGTNVPILKWSMSDLSGSRDTGGYKATIKIKESIPVETIRDGALVVIFTEDYYNTTEQSIGGNALNRDSIRFAGYIVDGTIEENYKEGWVEFDVESPTGIMQKCEGFSVSVESKSSPSTWYELLDMNCKRAMYHYLRWHSTVLQCCDFEFIGTDQYIQYFDADRTSLYDAIHNFIDGTLWGATVCDRQGKIWAEINYDAYSNGGALPSNMTLNDDDIMGTLSIDEREINETAFIEMGGIKYDGAAAGTFQALLCDAPGSAPAYQGKVERIEGLALSSQTQLNTLAGNVFVHRNSRYPSVDANLVGNYTNFDIAPQELAILNTSADKNPRGVAFNNKKFALLSCSLKYSADKLSELVSLGLAEVVTGFAADTVTIPDVPPTDSGGNPPLPNPIAPGGIIPGTVLGVGAAILSIRATSNSGTFSESQYVETVVFGTETIDSKNMISVPSQNVTIQANGIYTFFASGYLYANTPFSAYSDDANYSGINVLISISRLSGGISQSNVSSRFLYGSHNKWEVIVPLSVVFTRSFTVGDIIQVKISTYTDCAAGISISGDYTYAVDLSAWYSQS